SSVMTGAHDKAGFVHLFDDFSVKRERICSSVVDENRSNVLGKPGGGLSITTNPLLLLTFQLNRFTVAVCIVRGAGLLVFDQRLLIDDPRHSVCLWLNTDG